MHSILFCGIGGQGVLKASEICGVAALLDGYHVKKSEVHGMAQRGGSVESHLRFGDRVHSPLIRPGETDYLVCFHPDEESRLRHFLRADGKSFLPFIEHFEGTGIDGRFLNTYFLGILSAYLPISESSWLRALKTVFTRAQEKNREVFLQGAAFGKNRANS
jgi:indolepyruvate ferredoxin oxidoreductase beta subunit